VNHRSGTTPSNAIGVAGGGGRGEHGRAALHAGRYMGRRPGRPQVGFFAPGISALSALAPGRPGHRVELRYGVWLLGAVLTGLVVGALSQVLLG